MDNKPTRRVPSHKTFYAAGGVFLLYSLLLPLYRLSDYLLALALSALAYALSARLMPGEEIEPDEKPVLTGDAIADGAAKEASAYLDTLGGLRSRIESPVIRERLSSIDATTRKIISAIQADPKKAPMVRRLISYYLPTMIKLVDFYEKLENHGETGENIGGSMARIEDNLSTLDSALKKQLDLLYENDALDITTDISVMEGMLAQEGLSDGLSDKLNKMGGQ